MIMIFLKWFNPENQSLIGWRPIYVELGDTTGKLLDMIADMMGRQDEANQSMEIAMFEEVKPGMIERLTTTRTFAAHEIQNGDIIVLGPSKLYLPSDLCWVLKFRPDELRKDSNCVDIPSYYERWNKRTIEFCPMSPHQRKKESFACTVSGQLTSLIILERIAAYLKVGRNDLVLYGPTEGARPQTGGLKSPAERIVEAMKAIGTRVVMFYGVLEV
jgi:hypothetical protein